MAIESYPGARAIPASLAKARPRFTVAIPTFERPAYLRRAVLSALVQTLFPDEVLVVHRRDDNETVNDVRPAPKPSTRQSSSLRCGR